MFFDNEKTSCLLKSSSNLKSRALSIRIAIYITVLKVPVSIHFHCYSYRHDVVDHKFCSKIRETG